MVSIVVSCSIELGCVHTLGMSSQLLDEHYESIRAIY